MDPARIVQLTEADWESFADLRLRALAEEFGTRDDQYLREQQYTELQWRRRISEHTQFAAWLGDRPVGLVAAHRQSPETVYLYSLWLDPAVRGHGLAHALVAAALDWARVQRARAVYLRVAADNAAAYAVYTDLGFSPIHNVDAMAGEVAMAITVG